MINKCFQKNSTPRLAAAFALMLLISVSPARAELKRYSFSEAHLGTVARLLFYSDDPDHAKQAAKQAFQRIEKLNLIFSDYHENSELMQLSRRAHIEPVPVSAELYHVLDYAQQVFRKSGGVFDIRIGTQSKQWRESKNISHKELVKNNAAPQKNQALIQLNFPTKTVHLTRQGTRLDLGGIAKGYIADELLALLRDLGIERAVVAIGGEIAAGESPPGRIGWCIGVEMENRQVTSSVYLRKKALSTSGGTYQFDQNGKDKLIHVIDPRSGKNLSNQLNVTVFAPTAMQADAWATALRVLGTQHGKSIAEKEPNIEALFSLTEGKLIITSNFPKLEK